MNKNQWKISEVTFYIPVPNENSIDVCDLFSDGNPDQIKSWFCKQNHGCQTGGPYPGIISNPVQIGVSLL